MKQNILLLSFCTMCICLGLVLQTRKISVVTCKDENDMITYYNSVRNYMLDAQLRVYQKCSTKTINNFKFKEHRSQYLESKLIYK